MGPSERSGPYKEIPRATSKSTFTSEDKAQIRMVLESNNPVPLQHLLIVGAWDMIFETSRRNQKAYGVFSRGYTEETQEGYTVSLTEAVLQLKLSHLKPGMTSYQPVVAPVRNPRLQEGQIALKGIFLTRGGRFVAQMKRKTNGKNTYECLEPFPICTAAAVASEESETRETVRLPLTFPAKCISWIIDHN